VYVQTLSAFALTALLMIFYAPLASHMGLLDRPGPRKQHTGNIPLIGGVAIYCCLLVLLPLYTTMDTSLLWYLCASGLLVLFGLLDDRKNISVMIRVIVEIIAGMIMVYGAGLWVFDLGNLFGFGDLYMPRWLSMPFTIIAVFGITNAWNMIDGLDGLVGTITVISLGSYYYLTYGAVSNSVLPALMLGATAAFLLFNISNNRLLPKVFLGDAGSKLIGFTLVWLLIDCTQGGSLANQHLPASLALFVVAVPLIDMVATTVRRGRKGMHPFAPDRTHVHHILQHAGLDKQEVLIMITCAAILVNLTGIVMYRLAAPDWLMFAVFWAFAAFHFATIGHAWKLGKWLHRIISRQSRS
jgi:UDP-GlcNAc:undecaprenyl-phosphate GlcNAc-1-phosphate transferase